MQIGCHRILRCFVKTCDFNTRRTTKWRRPRGCLKSQVIFCKKATTYRALLLKMTYKDKASYESSPPCRIFTKFIICTILLSGSNREPMDRILVRWFYIISRFCATLSAFGYTCSQWRCNTLQQSAILCNTLQHTAAHIYLLFLALQQNE